MTEVSALPILASLDDYLIHYATSEPVAPAFYGDEEPLTYAELLSRTNLYASALSDVGVRRGDVVGVLSHSRPECLITFLACCRVGALYLGLNPKYTARELQFILNDASPEVILDLCGVADPDQTEKLLNSLSRTGSTSVVVVRGRPSTERWVSLAEFLQVRALDPDGITPPQDPRSPCAIVYTSGSTGSPKGALLCQQGMIRSAALSWQYWYGHIPGMRTVAQHPVNHVGWLVGECIAALVAGGVVFFRERFDGGATLELIETQRLDVWVAFPSMVQLAIQSDRFATCDLSSLKRVAFGMTPSLELLTRFRTKTDATLSVSYGLTEACGGAITVTDEADEPSLVASTVGRVVPGIEVRISGSPSGTMEPGVVGEILVRDSTVFLGYWNRPDATAAAIDADGWLHTGDVGVVDESGVVRLVGRMKEMFKSGGYNVYPTEIENVLGSHDMVRQVAVVERPDPLWSESGVAFVVPIRPGSLNSEDLRQYLRERLANYKIPKAVVFVESLPLVANGKVDKVKLRALARNLEDPA